MSNFVFTNGTSLFASDGTLANTHSIPGLTEPNWLFDVNGEAFFAASDSVHGRELWKTDGTPNGTVIVSDIYPGSGGSAPSDIVAFKNEAFFNATDGVHGIQLWKSNGSTAGTLQVTNLATGQNFNPAPTDLTVFNGHLFFAANTPSGRGLFVTDGTSQGTQQLGTVSPQVGFVNNPIPFLPIGLKLIFLDQSNNVYTTDGTTAGTAQIFPYPATTSLVSSGQLAYFASGAALYNTDGVSTRLVTNISSQANSSIQFLTNVNGEIYFVGDSGIGPQIWKSDGTASGTVPITAFQNSNGQKLYAQGLTSFNGALYFLASTSSTGPLSLYEIKGTSSSLRVVNNFSGEPGALSVIDNKLAISTATATYLFDGASTFLLYNGSGFQFTDVETKTPPSISFNSKVSFSAANVATFEGRVADASNSVKSIQIYNNGVNLGRATLNGDGTWTLPQVILTDGAQKLSAVATDASGNTLASSSAMFSLQIGITGQPYTYHEVDFDQSGKFIGEYFTKQGGRLYLSDVVVSNYSNGNHQVDYTQGAYFKNKSFFYKSDTFSSTYSELLQETLYNNDGTHSITGFADNQRLQSIEGDYMTGGGAAETFVFSGHFGQEVISDFKSAGPAHDFIDISYSGISNANQIIGRTHNSSEGAIIRISANDSITIYNVTKAELREHRGQFIVHG